ncbi:hypothetical protein [Candidatus Hodarchaeum mangrovi]
MFSLTKRETTGLIIGTIVFVVVEISTFWQDFNLLELIILVILISPLFLLHELGHKYTAIYNDMTSEFYLDQNAALLSLFSVFLPLKIIAPGVVLSSGYHTPKIEARIAMIGPLINTFLSGFLLIISSFIIDDWRIILSIVSKASSDIALFNILPFFVLDGAKVYRWNKLVFWTIFLIVIIIWSFHPLGLGIRILESVFYG